MLTQAQLMEHLTYDPNTGMFIRRISISDRIKAGDFAGNQGKRGYRNICVLSRKYPAHRLAWLYMTGAWPTHQIDHRNGDKGDNRFSNLREATVQENSRNVGLRKDNKTGAKGVHRTKNNRWMAVIQYEKKQIYLGAFNTIEEACAARDAAGRVLHKDFYHGVGPRWT